MYELIPLSVPSIKGNEWKYIKECLDTEWVSSAGKYVNLFEQKIAEYTGVKYAVACVNGTSALHVSLIVSGLQPEDEVIVPTITFIAPINSVKYCNANPIFMDADKYYNIDVEKTIEFILNKTEYKNGYCYNKVTSRIIRAVIPVHIFGNAVWMDELFSLCVERNIKIIEDATEALGTKYTSGKFKNKHAGTIGDLGCLSFNGNKIITTGGGGMILTDNKEYAEKAKYLTTQAKDDELRYLHGEIGYNYRLTNIQAALGVAQLEQLPEYIKIKKENFCYYKKFINEIEGLVLNDFPEYADNNHWMYALQIQPNIYGKNKEELIIYLKNNFIESRPVWQLNHLQKPFINHQVYKIDKAQELLNNTINIPCSVKLTNEQIEYIYSILRKGK